MIKSKFKYSTLLVILVVLAGTFFYSCQSDEIQETSSIDLPYLAFSENAKTDDISNLSKEDEHILVQAFQRIKIIREDGLYRITTKSAAQINISKELFDCFEGIVKKNNERILNYNFSLASRTKSGSESGGSSNNCVALAIVNIAGQMGSSMSLSEVEGWIEGRYGTNGVPSNKMSEVMNHYFYYESVSIYNGYLPPEGQEILIVFRGGENEGHAVRYLSCYGGQVLGSDGTYCELSQVAQAYLIQEVRRSEYAGFTTVGSIFQREG